MKKTLFTLLTHSILLGFLFTSCGMPSKKSEEAKENEIKSSEEQERLDREYLIEYDAYKHEAADKIAANEQSVIDFKARIKDQKQEARDDYNRKIEALEQKNSDMKKKLEDYKADGKDKWASFKNEFNRDMDELGKAFHDLSVDNVK